MPTAVMTSKGQVTIPKEVRDRLGIAKGDRLEFILASDGSVQLRPVVRSVRELAGFLHRPGLQAATQEEMDEAIVELLATDDERIRSRS